MIGSPRVSLLSGKILALIPTRTFELKTEVSNSDCKVYFECEIYRVQENFLHTSKMITHKVFIGDKDDQDVFNLLYWRDGGTLSDPHIGTLYTYWLLLHKVETKNDYYFALLGCEPGVKSSNG